jgi:hypothetical protein
MRGSTVFGNVFVHLLNIFGDLIHTNNTIITITNTTLYCIV